MQHVVFFCFSHRISFSHFCENVLMELDMVLASWTSMFLLKIFFWEVLLIDFDPTKNSCGNLFLNVHGYLQRNPEDKHINLAKKAFIMAEDPKANACWRKKTQASGEKWLASWPGNWVTTSTIKDQACTKSFIDEGELLLSNTGLLAGLEREGPPVMPSRFLYMKRAHVSWDACLCAFAQLLETKAPSDISKTAL